MTQVDDIQSFIAAQKKRIEEERAGLSKPTFSPRNVTQRNYGNDYKTPQNNNTNVTREEQPKAMKEDASPGGLQLGGYENVQEKLKKERAEEYRKFLAEKNYRTTGHKSPRDKPAVTDKPPVKSSLKQDYGSPNVPAAKPTSFNQDHSDLTRRSLDHKSRWQATATRARPEKTLDELYDAYEELLERKRQDERRYRGAMEDPYLDSRHVRFKDERRNQTQREPWLENGTRRHWNEPDKDLNRARRYSNNEYEDSRTFENFQEKSLSRNQNVPEDRVSRSAPPTAVPAIPIVGEHDMSPEVKQQRQTKYREELQAQMKEREMLKKREKQHVVDSREQDSGLNGFSNGNSSPRRYQPSFPGNAEQPRQVQAPPGLSHQSYQPNFPQNNNLLPQSQLTYDKSYNYPSYLNQPMNYPSSLLSTLNPSLSTLNPSLSTLNPSLSTLNPSSGLLGGYPSSFREPFGGYQPSWAADNSGRGQRVSGLDSGQTSGILDRNAPITTRLNQSNGLSDRNVSHSGFEALSQHDRGKERDRSKQQSYREELTRQMMEKQERKKKDKEDVERYNLKLEREIEEYNPWGKSGGGAPLRDQTGKLVSDLRQMHQYNKEGTIISPRDRGKNVEPSLVKENLNSSIERKPAGVSPAPKVDQFQTSPVKAANEDMQTRSAQQEYKEYLRQQVEEKQRKKKEEDDRQREIEERQDKIIQEQQKKLKEEYEKELKAAKQKEEAARQKNEELRKAAEEKKKEMERKRLEEDRKQEEKLKKQLEERLKAAKAKNTNRSESPPVPSTQRGERSHSPPIPTLQKKVEDNNRPVSPPIPTLQNKIRSDSPPIPTLQNKDREEESNDKDLRRQKSADRQYSRPSSSSRRDAQKQGTPSGNFEESYNQARRSRPSSTTADIDVLSQLTSLRKQLKKEEIKVQQQLSENKEKYVKLRESSGVKRNKKSSGGNVFDNVFRKQPSISQKYNDSQTSGAIDEFNKLKYEDNSSLHGDFMSKYPEPATSPSTLDLQQKSLLKEQQKRLQTFRDAVLTSDKENHESFGNNARPPSSTSQLESDSQFVPVNDSSQVPQIDSSKPSPRMPSARERRRWKQLENLAKAPKLSDYKPPTPDGVSLNSTTSFNVDELAQKNEERLRRLEAMKQARSESKGDPNEVLKRFIQQHSRPDSKVSENSLPADKRYLPNM